MTDPMLMKARLSRSATCALAAVLVSVVLVPARAHAVSNTSIAKLANSYANGSKQGQCIVFVANVLRRASGGRISISAYAQGYQGTYRANGGKLIQDPNKAIPGDVLQITPAGTSDSWKGPEYPPLHTAIVLGNRGGGSFDVIDSNARMDERVSRHSYSPYRRSAKVRIWRMGTVPPPPKPASARCR